MEQSEPNFRYLSNEEFEKLSQEQKISYLGRAIAALTSEKTLPSPLAPTKQDPEKPE